MPEKRSRTFSLSATVDLPLLGKVGVTEGDSRHACAEASISTFDELKGFNRDRPAVAADQARRGEGGGDHAFTFVPAGFHPLATRLSCWFRLRHARTLRSEARRVGKGVARK